MTVCPAGHAPRGMRSPITWYGGKGRTAHLIVPLLPPHEVYLEPFAGGLSVLFAKQPARLETINDLDSGVVNFYRVLRDEQHYACFRRLVELTPYAREEYLTCRMTWRDYPDPVHRAWAWFIMVRQAYGGGGRHRPTAGWKYEHGGSDGTSFGYSSGDPSGSAAHRWLTAVDGLDQTHARLRSVQLEHGDWSHVLRTYGQPGACVYLDPPYVLQTRTGGKRYECEMSLEDHHALTAALLASPALCVLSGYRVAAVHEPLERAGWERRTFDVPLNVARFGSGTAPRRTESVWRNPAACQAWQAAQWPLFSATSSPGAAR